MSRVLLADDSPQALRLAEQILKAQGLEVVSVTDGAVAMRRLGDVKPDVLIIDVYLPTKNAFDIARFMKAEPQFRDIPIIFAAAPADRFDETDAKNAGAAFIIRKPFEASILLDVVEKLIQRRAASKNENKQTENPFDRSSVHAAVTLALEAAMPLLIDELTERVVLALSNRR
jgi:DNA-binding response OmpR family regulator